MSVKSIPSTGSHIHGWADIQSMANDFVYVDDYRAPHFPVGPISRVEIKPDKMDIYYAVDQSYPSPVQITNEVSEIEDYSAMFSFLGKGNREKAQASLDKAVQFRVPDVIVQKKDPFKTYLRYLDYVFLSSITPVEHVTLVDPEDSIILKIQKKGNPYDIVFCHGSRKYKKNRLANNSLYERARVISYRKIDSFYNEYVGKDTVFYFGVSATQYKVSLFGRAYGFHLYPHHPMAVDHGIADFDGNSYYDSLLGGIIDYEGYRWLRMEDVNDRTWVTNQHEKYQGLYGVYSTLSPPAKLYAKKEVIDRVIPDMYVLEGESETTTEEREIELKGKTKKIPVQVNSRGVVDMALPYRFAEKLDLMKKNNIDTSWRSLRHCDLDQFYQIGMSPHFNSIYQMPLWNCSPEPMPAAYYRFTEKKRPSRDSYVSEPMVTERDGNKEYVYKAKIPGFGILKEIYPYRAKLANGNIGGVLPESVRKIMLNREASLYYPDPKGKIYFSYTLLKTNLMQETGYSLSRPTGTEIDFFSRYFSWYDQDNCTDLGNWNVGIKTTFQRYDINYDSWEPE
jgi:hypothetical protein